MDYNCQTQKFTNMDENFKNAIQYVRENKTWSDAEEQVALEKMDKWRCSLDETITDEISELMEDYGIYNDLEEGWWEEYGTAEDIFFMLDEETTLPNDFSQMQEKVINESYCYKNSSAFKKAMNYLADNNFDFYAELIQLEYNEAFGK